MKRRTRRSFTNEFKHEAASLVIDQGYTMAEACRAMGVGPTAMRHWVLQLEGEHREITPKAKALTPNQQRIQQLEQRVKQLEQRVKQLEREKSILTALLMSDEMQHLRSSTN